MFRYSIHALAAFLIVVAFPQLASALTITVTHGDVDGFGFTDTSGLLNSAGSAADVNGNGQLEAGEFLPDLGGDGSVDFADPDDRFDNRSGDPLNTDAFLFFNSDVVIDFTYTIPAGFTIISAELRLLAGDPTLNEQTFHTIAIDGIATGSFLQGQDSSQPNGDIVETAINLPSSFFPLLTDGQAQLVIDYSAANPDDVAFDYLQLNLVVVPEPSTVSMVLLGLLGFATKVRLFRRAA